MRKLFNEYSVLLLCFVCSVIGFNILKDTVMNAGGIYALLTRFLYGIL